MIQATFAGVDQQVPLPSANLYAVLSGKVYVLHAHQKDQALYIPQMFAFPQMDFAVCSKCPNRDEDLALLTRTIVRKLPLLSGGWSWEAVLKYWQFPVEAFRVTAVFKEQTDGAS